MSTANHVRETFELSGDDALATMRRANVGCLMRDSLVRLRAADGFSHSRATAFQIVLVMIPAAVVLVALAVALDSQTLADAVISTAESLAPGPASDVFRQAFEQGAQDATRPSGWPAVLFGALAMVVAGTTAFGQIERTANRIYGVESDRPAVRKYGLALALTLSAGTLSIASFTAIGFGAGVLERSGASLLWQVGRWPLGALALVGVVALIFKLSPRRHQPQLSWLAVGGLLAVACSVVVSLLMHAYLEASRSFGDTYGPLAGFIGVLLWAYFTSVALYFGLSFAAQLEAVRAGDPQARSATKDDDVHVAVARSA